MFNIPPYYNNLNLTIHLPLLMCCVFSCFQVTNYCTFISFNELLSVILIRPVYKQWIAPASGCLGKFLFHLHLWKTSVLDILGWQFFFSFSHSNTSAHSFLTCTVSADSLIGVFVRYNLLLILLRYSLFYFWQLY